MKLGLQIPNFTWTGGPAQLARHLAQIARRAEQAGFSSLWVMDHFFQIEFVGAADMDMLEGYSVLSYLAAHTSRIGLGTMVTGNTYRHPGILVKTVTTLDTLSEGRAWFGVGAGWYEREHRGLGVTFPSLSERFERLEETLRIALQMWAGNRGAFEGRHYTLEETMCVPAPVARPHPPILIGGMGEQKTLRLVARYAQGCNLFEFAGNDVLKKKLDILREHCRAEGRPYDGIEKTTLGMLYLDGKGAQGAVSPAQLLERLHGLAELGIDQAIYRFRDVTDPALFDLLGSEVIPAASKIPVAGRPG